MLAFSLIWLRAILLTCMFEALTGPAGQPSQNSLP